MSTTAFGLVIVPTFLAVWLGTVMGFGIVSMMQGIEAQRPERGPRPTTAGRGPAPADRTAQVDGPEGRSASPRRDEIGPHAGSPTPSPWPRPWM